MTRNDDDPDQPAEPSVNRPLNAPPRPTVRPVLMLIAFVAALVLFYFFGLEVLVPAD